MKATPSSLTDVATAASPHIDTPGVVGDENARLTHSDTGLVVGGVTVGPKPSPLARIPIRGRGVHFADEQRIGRAIQDARKALRCEFRPTAGTAPMVMWPGSRPYVVEDTTIVGAETVGLIGIQPAGSRAGTTHGTIGSRRIMHIATRSATRLLQPPDIDV